QLTMTASDYAVTGPVLTPVSEDSIRAGAIGNLLNLYGADNVHRIQRIAVEESRLRIPLLLGFDVIHGMRTVFPIPLAEAGLFDPEAWQATARAAAQEAANDGLHLTFAPMLDVARDPRWGRIAEGPGEDAALASAFARAKVHGYQNGSLSDQGAIAACAKHYVGYGAVTAGREYASTDMSDMMLREVYLPPFRAAVESGVATIMPAFTDLNGVPMTANKMLLKDVLRGEMGFDGVLITDYNAIAELINHGVAADLTEAAALALTAGVDIDMMSDSYRRGLPAALERGLVTMADIDTSVRRVLMLKERLDLFQDPYRRGRAATDTAGTARRRALARDVASRSLVLLKNERKALPLAGRKLAVIGPLADAAGEMRGPWWGAGKPEECVSVLAGLQAAGLNLRHTPGVTITGDDTSGINAAAALCDDADAVLLCLGEAATMSGEAASRAHLGLPGLQQQLADAVFARAQGKPVIVLLFSGRPLVIPDLAARADALLAAWFPGSEAGNAIADVLTGKTSPSGKTPVSWPRAVGQIPIFFGQRPGGRPFNPADHYTSHYSDVDNTPQFPFGHGLSYGAFEIANLRLTAEGATVDVVNSGTVEAEETFFLF
ncbi:MAG TPA: glycoside hydrolase family 3 N-terminal domain-containing protein, partial [Rhizomicrobium sp.]|nr:glycoside hydrolase family 3 N-terminal domain-containing protein [Rhizomicrobium sp.]